jgi:beta-glucosidase
LSYTKFSYGRLVTSAETLSESGKLAVRFDVTNTGGKSGEEVVQLYVQHLDSKIKRPRKGLVGYQRVQLKPCGTRAVEMRLRAQDIAYWDSAAQLWAVELERIRLQVGASSADIRLEKV